MLPRTEGTASNVKTVGRDLGTSIDQRKKFQKVSKKFSIGEDFVDRRRILSIGEEF